MQVEGCCDPEEQKGVLDQYSGLAKCILTFSAREVSGHVWALSSSLAKCCWLQELVHLRAGLCGKAAELTAFPGASQGPVPMAHGSPLTGMQQSLRMESLEWESGTLPGQGFQEKAYSTPRGAGDDLGLSIFWWDIRSKQKASEEDEECVLSGSLP